MLMISPTASQAIRAIVDDAELPDEAGLRISTGPSPEGTQQVLSVGLTDQPLDGDQIVEEEGAHVFIETEVVPIVEDMVLDADVQEGAVRFSLLPQASEASPNGAAPGV